MIKMTHHLSWLLLLVGVTCGGSRTALPILPQGDGSPTMGLGESDSDKGSAIATQPPINGACPAGFDPCGNGEGLRCHDLSRSNNHCGACGNACAPGIACRAGSCQYYRCKGSLSFKTPATNGTVDDTGAGRPYIPALGDFDGDGYLDLVGMPTAVGPMNLPYGAGDRTFPTRRVIDPDTNWEWLAIAADVDGDGFLDLTSMKF